MRMRWVYLGVVGISPVDGGRVSPPAGHFSVGGQGHHLGGVHRDGDHRKGLGMPRQHLSKKNGRGRRGGVIFSTMELMRG